MKRSLLLLLMLAPFTLRGADNDVQNQLLDAESQVVSKQEWGSQVKDGLSESTSVDGSVTINEKGEAAELIRSINTSSRAGYVRGYRVGIFFDNGQSARYLAAQTRNKFRDTYPEISVYLTYENPYFKVAAGDCITQEEAVILLEKVRHNFPKAFIQRDNIAIEDI